ncbi:MAG: ComF family protein, partial [Armatimonadetes bacterium]|nr:ComF family protein [Armatimonadota bacterium]
GDAEHRARNVANAFAVADPESVRGKRVLVVDDVVTTLHTVNECARVLTEAGARAVYVVSVAG